MFGIINKLILFKRRLFRPVWRFKYIFFRQELPNNTEGKVYINLGSGNNTSAEFTNINAVPFRHTHIVGDITDLSDLSSNSVDMLYASHVIEHIPRSQLVRAFREWHRVLKHGTFLRFGVPDFDRLVDVYNVSGKKIESIESQLMGQGESGYDDHHSIWNFDYAKRLLFEAGFRGEVRLWDVNKVNHHAFKDKSNRVFEIEGKVIPLSLNIEAFK
ncbi:MAG: hypothetical protein A3G52_02360 [Candidatus Taylorbacteria bacterium RIFCSPLOWO2_12_FULL_43_20]|uniref:Methyltransferase type 11 domain-containing protein n=1 Tax=Candidatus Taylorbacteria bacterium RIFCSPLOWO2_12_FULL_43_20 TaxID=1802332 RepID=A0A1G2P3M2_9BACT|nr:MAG: hypothetical protein A3E92_02755 [Candidatus Taylorbacteria bacterium RIFCSPHIGHO2_12_FULL_42_34]OHA42936.1 MAG: hypothetical protein A3G52_02360 [Candidatus Taylorbacteria bacterium RIFCSPLOWO2_12_FULL_43_20]